MNVFATALIAAIAAACSACRDRDAPLNTLAERVAPQLKDRIEFVTDATVQTITVAAADNGHIRITAPNRRLAAAGLGQYLRASGAHWSWCGRNTDVTFTPPAEPLTFTPAFDTLLAYNYCTLSYTMAYWDEAAWREELDRLALYGTDRLLVQAGLPEVWRRTLRDLGYPEERIRAFLPDEAAAAWWNMGNLEGLGGPLTDSQILRNAAIGRFIVREAQALGMQPILQSFTGLVPHDLGDYLDRHAFPDVKIVDQGNWVDGLRRPVLLSPLCGAFPKIAAIWYKHLKAVYGTDRISLLAGDLFHEGGRTGGLNVTECARAVQTAQQQACPGAVWMIQAWQANPTPALLAGLNPKYTMVEALVRDLHRGQDYSRSFRGLPWLWCELLNFGGNQGMYGGLKTVSELGQLQTKSTAQSLKGLGLLSEGLETNPVFYELFLRRMFVPANTIMTQEQRETAIDDILRCRYGMITPDIRSAWRLLERSVYSPVREQEGCTESIVCAKPGWTVSKASTWSSGALYYSPADTRDAAKALLAATEKQPDLLKSETFVYDLADVARQALSDAGRGLLARVRDSRKPTDAQAFLEAIRLTDTVLTHSPRWRLDFVEDRVRRYGGEAAVRGYRRMITTWTGRPGSLNEYAHRQLAGLLSGYYLKRWEAFFDAALQGKNADTELNRLAVAVPTAPLPPLPACNPKQLPEAVRNALTFLERVYSESPHYFTVTKGISWMLADGKDNPPGAEQQLIIDVTDILRKHREGTYTATFKWTHGGNALKIAKVELLEDSRVLSDDTHAGRTGWVTEDNTYTVRLPEFSRNLVRYTLRITCAGDGGNQSAGQLFFVPNAPAAQK